MYSLYVHTRLLECFVTSISTIHGRNIASNICHIIRAGDILLAIYISSVHHMYTCGYTTVFVCTRKLMYTVCNLYIQISYVK